MILLDGCQNIKRNAWADWKTNSFHFILTLWASLFPFLLMAHNGWKERESFWPLMSFLHTVNTKKKERNDRQPPTNKRKHVADRWSFPSLSFDWPWRKGFLSERKEKTTSADHVKEMKWFDRHSFLSFLSFEESHARSADLTFLFLN